MPPRWLSLAIVAFWLATTGWLFYHDIWPYLRPGTPPPFSVDLIDEVQTRRPPTLWTVKQNGRKVFQGRTRIAHPSPEVFELHAEMISQAGCAPATVSGCRVRRLESTYRIDVDGNLLGVEVEMEGRPEAGVFLDVFKGDFTVRIAGEVAGGVFRPRLEVPGVLKRPLTLPEVEVPAGGGVLLPLHPLNRLRGLWPGQRWTLAVIDPVMDSLQAVQGLGGGPHLLAARVLPDPETIESGRRKGTTCLVVELQGEDDLVRLWVDTRTSLVLRQEAHLGSNHWVMDRD